MAINIIMFETKQAERDFLKKNHYENCEITFFEECLDEEFVKTLPQDILEKTNAISIFDNSTITKEVIEKFKNLRVVSVRAAIYDNICISSCEDKNIAVVNIPDFGTQSVAEYTIGLMINLTRNIIPANNLLKRGEKYQGGLIGKDLNGLTLGIVGTGVQGAMVCKLAKSFGMDIAAYDLFPRQELVDKYSVKYLSLEELANVSDIITIHLDYIPETYHIFNEEIFSKCKDSMYFINTSKSEIVDIEALDKYLQNGKIKGAAMDTSPCNSICYNCRQLNEKLYPSNLNCLSQSDFLSKFEQYDNVIITPCLSYTTGNAIENNLTETINGIKKVLNGEKLCRVV